MPSSMVRLTVQSWSCDRRTASGSTARAASPPSPGGNTTRKVTSMAARWLPPESRTLSAPTSTPNASGSARREVRMSTSIAVHPPSAARSSSEGVKSASSPVPMAIRPPRSLRAVNRPAVTLSMDTPRCAGSVAMPSTLPDVRVRPEAPVVPGSPVVTGSPVVPRGPVQPAQQVRRGQLGRPLVVAGQLGRAELLAPGPGGAPPEEGGAALQDARRPDDAVGAGPHLLERGRVDQPGPGGGGHGDPEPAGQAAHLAAGVRGQVVVVGEHDVRLAAPRPGVGEVPHHAGQRVHPLLRGGVLVDPAGQPVVQRRLRWRRPGRLGLPGQPPDLGPVDVAALVVEGNGHVERMA